jgi:actin-like ATPase involved in cell morphogenesis
VKLGVDFGTTRIVVSAADRGNYPLIEFEGADGHTHDWFPPLVAVRGDQRLYGWDTWEVQGDPSWNVIRSVKRLLKDAGPSSHIQIDGQEVAVRELLSGVTQALREQIRATLRPGRGESLEVMLGVPANANSNQRFLTADAFRDAGFQVIGMVNEPSAASIESGHRERGSRAGQPGRLLLVYDLGGGTFDASLVEVEEDTHTVLGTAGLADVGGDDFDEVLASLALEAAGIDDGELTAGERFRLLEECRERKESLNPNTRKLVIDLDRAHEGWGSVAIAAAEFYERCRPWIERTQHVVEELLAADAERTIETLYVTGGGSELPAVARVLKETFGRRVRRSSYMRSATAIGLAIAADARSGYRLRDRFGRCFGVWREADEGRRVSFDILFPRGLELPRPGGEPLRAARSYDSAHNIGHFRFIECSRLDEQGEPVGDVTVWDDIRFPFDPALLEQGDLAMVPVERNADGAGFAVEEEYACDANGMVKVTIWNRSAGHQREYCLGRWAPEPAPVGGRRSPASGWNRRHRSGA